MVPLRSLGAAGGEALLTVVTRLVVLVAGLATAILTARLLGPEGRGLYFYALTVAALVSQFGSLGFASSNTYFVAREPHYLGPLAANSVWLSLFVYVVASLVVVLAMGPDKGPSFLMLLAVLLGTTSLFFMLFSNLLVGMQRLIAFNLLQLGANLTVVPAILLAAWLSGAPEMLLIGSIAANLLFCLIAAVVLFRRQGFSLHPAPDVFRQSINYSMRAFLITLLGYGVARANVFALEGVSGHTEVGFYSVAVQIGDALAILPSSIALVVFPRLIRQQEGRYVEMLRLARIVTGLGLLVAVIAAFLAEPFVRIAFGEEFVPSLPIVYAMLPGSLFLGTATIVSQYMAASGMPLRTFAPWIAAAATLVGAAWYLIPIYSGIGAAGALSISYAVLLAGMILAAMSLDRQERLTKAAAQQANNLGGSR